LVERCGHIAVRACGIGISLAMRAVSRPLCPSSIETVSVVATSTMRCILFADDSINIRTLCKQELEGEGYRVLLAADGEEAVRLVQYASVDLAILDIGMPIVSGLEAARQIKSIAPTLPIVFFTAQSGAGMPNRWSELALGCIEKSGGLG